MDRPMVAAHDAVSEEVAMLVGGDSMGTTEEAEVHEGVLVTTPIPPTKTDIECGAAVRTIGTEVGRRKEQIYWGGG